MAISVNPPPQPRYPPEIANNQPVREYFDNLNRVILQLWKRTGGPTDAIDESQQSLTSTGSRVSRNAARINSLEEIRFEVVFTDSNLTTGPFEIIICENTGSIDITLDPNAVKGDRVHIKRTDAEVIVRGTIDGVVDKTLNVKYWSMHAVKGDAGWFVI